VIPSSELAEASMLLETEGRIWAIRPELLSRLASLDGAILSEDEFAKIAQSLKEARTLQVTPDKDGGNVATLPLKGVLMPQMSLLAELFGLGSSLASFRDELRKAVADTDVSHIVLDIDSPGGLVDHIPETAAEIRQAAGKKPVTAVANTLAASAAYWLGSQASEFVVTPSGEAGSIGVYSVHKDTSQAHEKAGVRPTIISAGKRKTEGNPYEPLSEDAVEGLQEAVNDYYSMFTRDVARGRGSSAADVREGFGEGRTLTARRAVGAGLVDRVDTLQGAIARAVKGGGIKVAFRADDSGLEDEDLDPQGDEEEDDDEVAYSSDERSRVLDTLVALGLND
jgi:capsid assembly protease